MRSLLVESSGNSYVLAIVTITFAGKLTTRLRRFSLVVSTRTTKMVYYTGIVNV